MDDLNNLIPSDLISIKAAARLVGNCHIASVRRWIFKGKLKGYRLAGTRLLVSKADVLNLIQPNVVHKPELPPTKREMTAQERWVDETLRAAKVRR